MPAQIAIPGEIDFSDDELEDYRLELASDDDTRRRRRRRTMPTPDGDTDRVAPVAPARAGERSLASTVRQPVFSETDLLVEAAFEAVAAAAPSRADADSPWDASDDHATGGHAEDFAIEDDLPGMKTAVTHASPQAATPAATAGAPPPPPLPEEESLVLSSSPAPDLAGPRVAVSVEASGSVWGQHASVLGAAPAPDGEGVELSDEIEDDIEDEPGARAARTTLPLPIISAAPPPTPAGAAVGPPLPARTDPRIETARAPAPSPPPVPATPSAAPAGTNGRGDAHRPSAPSATGVQRAAVTAAPPPPPAAAAGPAAEARAPSEPTTVRKKRRAKQWFEEIFDEDYLCTLPFMTPRQTERESAFIIDALGIQATASLLDVGCGYGRHAMELAARGHKVTGLDLSLPLLIRAADAARRAGVNVNFVHGDMREMTFDAEFDGAYSVFTTFGYFDDDTNRKVAGQIARSLRPGGRFLLEVINRDYLIRDLPTRVWWQGAGCVVLEEVDFNYFTSRLQVHRSIVFDDGRQSEQEISIRAYSLHEIGKVLHHAGFRVIEVSGALSLRGTFFGAESRQILVVAEKKES